MEIHVYDTYVKAADGHTMHFDVITGEKDHPFSSIGISTLSNSRMNALKFLLIPE